MLLRILLSSSTCHVINLLPLPSLSVSHAQSRGRQPLPCYRWHRSTFRRHTGTAATATARTRLSFLLPILSPVRDLAPSLLLCRHGQAPKPDLVTIHVLTIGEKSPQKLKLAAAATTGALFFHPLPRRSGPILPALCRLRPLARETDKNWLVMATHETRAALVRLGEAKAGEVLRGRRG